MPKVKPRNFRPPLKKILSKVEVKAPKVSVILTSYNHAAYVADAIQSVLNQTFTDFELLIYDDGSTDNSHEIIKTFDDPRIKTFLYEENRGPRVATMKAFNVVQGKYIAMHHSDDVWREDKLQKQVEFLDAHKEYAACFTWVNFIDENGSIQELPDGNLYKGVFDKENRTRAEWLNYFFYNANCLCHPSLLIRLDAYTKYNLIEVTKGLWQLPDYAMWIKLCFHANFYILDERLTLFRLRLHQRDNMSATTFDKRVRVESEMYFLLNTFLKNFNDDKFFIEVFPETKRYLINGEFNRKFAFAELCLKKDDEYFHLIGLKILKNLLSNDITAAQIKKLYNYDEKSFFIDTGHYDVFNLAQKLQMLEGKLYLDTGNDFNADEVIEKTIFVDPKGNFYAKYVFESDKPIKKLRFDPSEDFISLYMDDVKINGIAQKNFTVSLSKYDGKFYDFLTCDPQIIFPTENLTGRITLEIFAVIDKNYKLRLNTYFSEKDKQISKLNSEILRLNQRGKDLERVNENLNSRNEELNAQINSLNTQINSLNAQIENLNTQNKAANEHIDNLTAENQRLNGILNEVFNSKSWKLTKPLRKIGTFLKKFVKGE